MRRWLVFTCGWLAACGSPGGGATPGDGSIEAGPANEGGEDGDDASDGAEEQQEDATMGDDAAGDATTAADAQDEPVFLESGVQDAMIPMCTAPLPDAGFSTLAELPVAQLCAQSNGDLMQFGPPCQGSILVALPTNPGQWWLFNASTGQLEATGGGDDGFVWCNGGISGFQLPYQCWWNGGWPQQTDLCTD